MREIPHIGEIVGAEYYHEQENYDCRIAIRKLLDVYNTLYEAVTSLVYSDEKEYDENDIETLILRRSHLRHAVIDLNNCYDLLLQVPWFYYRIGLSCFTDIQRNESSWVDDLAKKCRESKLFDCMKKSSNCSQMEIQKELENFKSIYIENKNKPFTIRSLANYLKHNGSMQIKEFEKPLKMNVDLPEKERVKIDLTKLRIELKSEFYLEDNPTEPVGQIIIKDSKCALVDVEYIDGELFRGEDYSYYKQSHTLKEIHDECLSFLDGYIDLLEVIYQKIYLEIPKSPFFKSENVNVIKNVVDLNKWYKK